MKQDSPAYPSKPASLDTHAHSLHSGIDKRCLLLGSPLQQGMLLTCLFRQASTVIHRHCRDSQCQAIASAEAEVFGLSCPVSPLTKYLIDAVGCCQSSSLLPVCVSLTFQSCSWKDIEMMSTRRLSETSLSLGIVKFSEIPTRPVGIINSVPYRLIPGAERLELAVAIILF